VIVLTIGIVVVLTIGIVVVLSIGIVVVLSIGIGFALSEWELLGFGVFGEADRGGTGVVVPLGEGFAEVGVWPVEGIAGSEDWRSAFYA
jgi:hypothetical protein